MVMYMKFKDQIQQK